MICHTSQIVSKNLVDTDKNIFELKEVDISQCVNYIKAQQKDFDCNILMDSNGNQVLSEVMVVTNANDYEIARSYRNRKPELRRMRDRSLLDIKNCCLV